MAITVQKIEAVEVEIERFLERVSRLRELMVQVSRGDDREGWRGEIYPSSETGAIRRASMDLTRSLARLRSSKD